MRGSIKKKSGVHPSIVAFDSIAGRFQLLISSSTRIEQALTNARDYGRESTPLFPEGSRAKLRDKLGAARLTTHATIEVYFFLAKMVSE